MEMPPVSGFPRTGIATALDVVNELCLPAVFIDFAPVCVVLVRATN
jgi:hypothetical protein